MRGQWLARVPHRRNVGGGGPEVLREENYRPNFNRPTSPGRALGSGAAGAGGRHVEISAEAVLAEFLVVTLEFCGLQGASPWWHAHMNVRILYHIPILCQ